MQAVFNLRFTISATLLLMLNLLQSLKSEILIQNNNATYYFGKVQYHKNMFFPTHLTDLRVAYIFFQKPTVNSLSAITTQTRKYAKTHNGFLSAIHER